MTERTPKPPQRADDIELTEQVASQAARKIKARLDGAPGVWFGLGMMGLVGWSVAVPTLLGAALGLWLDSRPTAGGHSWTLALLMAGLTLGCLNAWHWVSREERNMHEENAGANGNAPDKGNIVRRSHEGEGPGDGHV